MADIDWELLGIDRNKHFDLTNEIRIHNNNILEKIDKFEEVIASSRVENKQAYTKLLNDHKEILRTVTIYHDIGKVRAKLNHGENSFDIIQETNILSKLNITAYHNVLVSSVIKNHLVFGTIFTGEWSLKKLYLLNKQVGISDKEEIFYRILVIFSVLDTWSYVDDMEYAIRLFYNYDQILQRFRQDRQEEHIKANLAWRLCCFLGIWRANDYLEENAMLSYEGVLRNKMESYYHYEIEDVREKIWQQFGMLEKANINYALVLLRSFCFDNAQQRKRNRIEDINIDDGLFYLLEDMVSTLRDIGTEEMWEILFTGYRESIERAQHIFQSIRDKKNLDMVINNKSIDKNDNKIVYKFDVL